VENTEWLKIILSILYLKMSKPKLIRITTVPISVEKLLGKQLTFMTQFFDVTAISSDRKRLEEIGRELKIKTFSIEMTRQITPFKDLKSLWLMYWYLRKAKPEIVHTHTPKAGLIGMIAAKLAGVKIRLHTVAGLPLMESMGVKRIMLDFVEKLTYSFASKIYPNSYGLKEFIIKEKFCNESKLKIIGNGSTNGIDLKHFDPELFSEKQKQSLKEELKISENDFVFVFVGRLVKDKGINELVVAFSKLIKSIKDKPQMPLVKLLLVGELESELDPLFPEVLEEINSNPNIIFVGFQKDVRLYFGISNVLVFPSYREGFPNVVMQAGAMGLPSIVTDINGCNEIIENEENGVVIPTKDEAAIQNAMKIFLENKEYYHNLQSNSRVKIADRYDQNEIWNAILEEYMRFS